LKLVLLWCSGQESQVLRAGSVEWRKIGNQEISCPHQLALYVGGNFGERNQA